MGQFYSGALQRQRRSVIEAGVLPLNFSRLYRPPDDIFGGAERDRTADLLVANEALSQLSYSPPPDAHCTPPSRGQRTVKRHLRVYQQAARRSNSKLRPPRARHRCSCGQRLFHHMPNLARAIDHNVQAPEPTSFTPLGATASSAPTSPAPNSVRSSAICQRCRPATARLLANIHHYCRKLHTHSCTHFNSPSCFTSSSRPTGYSPTRFAANHGDRS